MEERRYITITGEELEKIGRHLMRGALGEILVTIGISAAAFTALHMIFNWIRG